MALTLQRKLELAGALSRLQPQLQRLLSDDELHSRVRTAVGSGRKAYGLLGSDRDVHRIASQLSDKKTQKELRSFLDDLVAVSEYLKEEPKKRHHVRNVILVGSAVGAGAVIVLRRRRSGHNGSAGGNGDYTQADTPAWDAPATESA